MGVGGGVDRTTAGKMHALRIHTTVEITANELRNITVYG